MGRGYRHFGAVALWIIVALCSPSSLADSAVQQTNVDQARHSVDERGVPQLSIDGIGTVAHPAWTALYALAYAGVEDYDPALELKADEKRFEASIEWLKTNLVQDRGGLWVWPYAFDSTYNDVSIQAPWSSAFAQAVGIQALLAHSKKTGDKESLDLAVKAVEALFVPLEKGGFLFSSGNDIWFEEIPAPVDNPSHILNGHMRALLAIAELKDATGEARYQEWFAKGSDTLLRWLPLYDAGYWLRYDLNPRKEELLFRLANPYGFANPELAIDRIVLRDPVSGEESVLDVGSPGDAEGPLRIAGNDWGQIEQVDGRSVRRLRPVEGGREAPGSEGQMVAPYSYFYLKLPSEWKDNLRKERFELGVEYLDEHRGNLEVQIRSIAPENSDFHSVSDGELLLSGSGNWRQWKVPVKPRDIGYWVGKTYGLKHAEYLSRIAGRDRRFEAWSDTGRAYLNKLPGANYERVKPPVEKVPEQTPVLPWYSMDSQGVLMMHVQDGRSTLETGTAVYSPYIIASQAVDGQEMAGLNNILKKFNIDKASVSKGAALKWLLDFDNQIKVGAGVVYKFNFLNTYNDVVTPAPWQSSFAQTYVLKALHQSLKDGVADEVELENLIKSVLMAYSVDVADGGLAHSGRAAGLFFEEVPNRTHVLNAQLSALPVMHQVAAELNLSLGRELFEKGVESLADGLSRFDTGYWLRYDLNPKKELLFQLDWVSGDASPLIESISLDSPQFAKRNQLYVGSEQAFAGASRISGLDWLPVQQVDGKQARAFANGYLAHEEAVQGGARHNVYAVMQLPETKFSDYFDVQPHRLVILYKDMAAGQFVVKLQSINEGNVLDFTPLRNAVITTTGDQQWKEAVVEVRPQDMGWYKGADYQAYEVEQLEHIAKLTGDWFFAQYAERQRYYLDAKGRNEQVVVEPSFKPATEQIELEVIDASSTYDGFGFENALDGDPNNNYVAGLEGLPLEFVVLKAARSIKGGTINIKWESRNNYPRNLRVVALEGDGSVSQVLARTNLLDGLDVEIKLDSNQAFDSLRLEFSEFVGQPRLLMRLLELKSSSDEEGREAVPVVGPTLDILEGEYRSGRDVRNPLHVYRIPLTWEVKKLSDTLAGSADTDHQKVLAFMRYVDQFDVGVAKTPSPDDTIAERKGACGSFTNTLLALAAAQGFEGRVVSLLNYPKGDGHAVAEIKTDGRWALYDPTYGAFYTLKGSEVPLSLAELRLAYARGRDVTIHQSSHRTGADYYTGRNIFIKANPMGVIGADKPFVFPLEFDLAERNALDSSEFGARWQGADFIGAASTNQQQNWTFRGLEVGKRYRFEITAKWLGGDLAAEDSNFKLRALIKNESGVDTEMVHDFNFQSGESSWSISFLAVSESQQIFLGHDYLGPEYRYMVMQSYKVLEEN